MDNRPPSFDNRAASLRARLSFLTPTQAQIDALATVLSHEMAESYRLTIQREAARWGPGVWGELDPFVAAQLYQQAQQTARGVVNTLVREQERARVKSLTLPLDEQDEWLDHWRQSYLTRKAHQVLLNEYSRAHDQALKAFYRHSIIAHPLEARVEPPATSSHDLCRTWIEQGWVPLATALTVAFPAHPGCPHAWVVRKAGEHLPLADYQDIPTVETPSNAPENFDSSIPPDESSESRELPAGTDWLGRLAETPTAGDPTAQTPTDWLQTLGDPRPPVGTIDDFQRALAAPRTTSAGPNQLWLAGLAPHEENQS